jgi:hypothetical protein
MIDGVDTPLKNNSVRMNILEIKAISKGREGGKGNAQVGGVPGRLCSLPALIGTKYRQIWAITFATVSWYGFVIPLSRF